jgi:hypothetical protein
MVFCQNNWATWVYFGKYDDNPYCGASIQYKVDGVCQTNEYIWDLLGSYDNKSLHAEITLKKNLTSRKKSSRSSSVLCCTLVFNDLEYLMLFEDELIKINIINKILIVLVYTELLSTYH